MRSPSFHRFIELIEKGDRFYEACSVRDQL